MRPFWGMLIVSQPGGYVDDFDTEFDTDFPPDFNAYYLRSDVST